MKRILLVVVLLLLIGATAYAGYSYVQEDGGDLGVGSEETPTPSGSSEEPVPTAVPPEPTKVEMVLSVQMPPELDDGVPERRIKGEGVVDAGQGLAGVTWAIGKVPNSAGYFGHVPGKLEVIYEGPGFMATFPILREALAGGFEWMRYDFPVLTTEYAADLGVGQLREIGLADPRFLTTLVSLAGEKQSDLGEISGSVDLAEAGSRVPDELEQLFEDVAAMGINGVDVEAETDTDGLLASASFEFGYLPAQALERVELEIELQVGGPAEDSLELPEAELVQDYRDYLKL